MRTRDIRNHFTFSIDNKNTRVIDDLISINVHSEGVWRIGVHIPDVAQVIKEDSAVDTEARSRVESQYIGKHFYKPMIPRDLGVNFLPSEKPKFGLSLIFLMDS